MMVIVTNAQSAKHSPAGQNGIAARVVPPPTSTVATTGQRNWNQALAIVDFRQANSGPTPVRNRRMKPMGVIHLLKNGGPTVRRSPRTASLSVGNIVANSTKKAENNNTQLFTRNDASREIHESSSFRDRSSGSR